MQSSTHTIQRAIIMAAGKGERLRPITQTLPKPLISVNGIRMIESIIQALIKNHIREIYVVVGYKKEAFNTITDLYPNITLINNPYYNSCNNISSLYVAQELLQNCIILDGDQLIRNPNILDRRFSLSGYNAVWTDKATSEWLLTTENGIIKSCSRIGGSNGWQLYSISRWNAYDGNQLKDDVTIQFESGNRQLYWDDIPLFCYPEHYTLSTYKMNATDVVEIDSFDELVRIDRSYSEVKA